MIGDGERLVVCVGTGGVGKTTVAAAIALGAARQGRRAIVLTIDPARALARALGVTALAPGGEAITGTFSAAMLDQKYAWDRFITVHAPNANVAQALFANRFYQQLSTSFAGSTEYMALDEMCRLADSGRYDLVVLDTPPSAHAIDFLRAPERIDRLLDEPRDLAGSLARFVLRQLESAAGAITLHEIGTFFGALTALLDGIRARTRRSRTILRDAAFVLVTAPRAAILDDTAALAAGLRAQNARLAAIVVNRTHTAVPTNGTDLGESPAGRWLRERWNDAIAEAAAEAAVLEPALATLAIPHARIAEAPHDLHCLDDLAAVATQLVTRTACTT